MAPPFEFLTFAEPFPDQGDTCTLPPEVESDKCLWPRPDGAIPLLVVGATDGQDGAEQFTTVV